MKPWLTDADMSVIDEWIVSRDRKLFGKVVEIWRPCLIKIAQSLFWRAYRFCEVEDLRQYGYIGLASAINKMKLGTSKQSRQYYVYLCIKSEIIDAITSMRLAEVARDGKGITLHRIINDDDEEYQLPARRSHRKRMPSDRFEMYLENAIARLSKDEKRVMRLMVLKEKSSKELARDKVFGDKNHKAVSNIYWRAILKIRKDPEALVHLHKLIMEIEDEAVIS